MTTAEKLALALADGTLATDSIRVLMRRHSIGEHAVREARKAAGIVVKVGGRKPGHGLLYGLHGPVKVAIVRNAVRALVGADRIERVALRYGLTAEDVERVWGAPRVPPQQPDDPTPENVRAAWAKACNRPRPLATVAARFGISAEQVRAWVSR